MFRLFYSVLLMLGLSFLVACGDGGNSSSGGSKEEPKSEKSKIPDVKDSGTPHVGEYTTMYGDGTIPCMERKGLPENDKKALCARFDYLDKNHEYMFLVISYIIKQAETVNNAILLKDKIAKSHLNAPADRILASDLLGMAWAYTGLGVKSVDGHYEGNKSLYITDLDSGICGFPNLNIPDEKLTVIPSATGIVDLEVEVLNTCMVAFGVGEYLPEAVPLYVAGGIPFWVKSSVSNNDSVRNHPIFGDPEFVAAIAAEEGPRLLEWYDKYEENMMRMYKINPVDLMDRAIKHIEHRGGIDSILVGYVEKK